MSERVISDVDHLLRRLRGLLAAATREREDYVASGVEKPAAFCGGQQYAFRRAIEAVKKCSHGRGLR